MTGRPRIAVVSDAVLPYHRGGKEVRSWEIMSRVAQRATVDLYTMRWWGARGTRTHDGVTYHGVCRSRALYDGDRRSLGQAIIFALGCLRLIARPCSVIEADCIPYMHLYPLRVVATVRRKRLVVTWHEVWGSDYWEHYLGWRGRLAWWIERTAMRLPDEIIAVSEETKRRIQSYTGATVNVTVAPNGIDLDAIRRAPVADGPVTLVTVGRLLANKRVDLLFDAVARLRDRGTTVTCRVIGDGPERGALEARAQALGIGPQVEFCTDVADQATLYSLVKAARVFVFASEREGFGIAVLEALACGLPVVTTSAPDNLSAQLVYDSGAGVVCEPTADGLADAIVGVLERAAPPVAEAAWLSAFDWDAIAETVLATILGRERPAQGEHDPFSPGRPVVARDVDARAPMTADRQVPG